MIKFLDLHQQYITIKDELDAAMAAVIRDSAYIGGQYVERFENEFAKYQDAKHCVGVGNGTDALEIAIESLGLPPKSEIIVPANSFIASAEAVTRSGHKVVFCDIISDDFTMSVEDVASRINDNTAAIMAVHLYGHPCDMEPLKQLAKKNNLRIIEDCAQAHGAEYKNHRVGAIGDIGAFSFYPGKNLGAYGDGGAIVTNDEALATRCRMIANHGRIAKYNHEFEGRNSRLDGLQAAILSVKLKHLDQWLRTRRNLAKVYEKGLGEMDDLIISKPKSWALHAYHLWVLRTKKRDALKGYLSERDIATGIHYPISLPQLPAYEYTGQNEDNMLANVVGAELISLPIGDHLDEEQVKHVVSLVKKFFDH